MWQVFANQFELNEELDWEKKKKNISNRKIPLATYTQQQKKHFQSCLECLNNSVTKESDKNIL